MLKIKKLTIAISAITLAISGSAFADNHAADGAFDGAFSTSWDQFIDDSSFDYRLRGSHFDLSLHRGTIENNYSLTQLTDIAETYQKVDLATLTGLLRILTSNPFLPPEAVASLDRDTLQDSIAGSEAAVSHMLNTLKMRVTSAKQVLAFGLTSVPAISMMSLVSISVLTEVKLFPAQVPAASWLLIMAIQL